MQRIAAASNLIRKLTGPFCSTLATALLERGFDLGQEVLPAIMHTLATGPGSAAPSQGMRRLPLPWLCPCKLHLEHHRLVLVLTAFIIQAGTKKLDLLPCSHHAETCHVQGPHLQQQHLRACAANGGASAPSLRLM